MIDLSEVSTSDKQKRLMIGVPFFLLVTLALPLLLLLAPVVLMACLAVGADPVRAFSLLWGVLKALRGSHVEITERNHSVLVHIS